MATNDDDIDALIERARDLRAGPSRENLMPPEKIRARAGPPLPEGGYQIMAHGRPLEEILGTGEGWAREAEELRRNGGLTAPPAPGRRAPAPAPAPEPTDDIDALLARSRARTAPDQPTSRTLQGMGMDEYAAANQAEYAAAAAAAPRPKAPPAPFTEPPTREQVRRQMKLDADDAEYAEDSAEAGRIRSFVGGVTGGFGSTIAGIPESAGELYLAAKKKVTGETPLREDNPLINFGEDIRRATRGPVNPDHEFAGMLGQGFGSTFGFIAGGFAGRALKLGAMATTAGVGAATVGAEGARDAHAHDADADTRFKSFLLNAGFGLTEAAPLAAMFNRLDKGSGGFLSRYMATSFRKNILVQGASGAVEEAIQEAIQNVGANAIAKALYDGDRTLMDHVPEGTAVGGIVGFTMSALMTALGGRNRATDLSGKPLAMPPKGPAERASEAAGGGTAATPPPPPTAPGAPPAERPAEEAANADDLLGADPEEKATGPTVTAAELRAHAERRLRELDDKAKGTKGRTVIDPQTGEKVTIPDTLPQYLSAADSAERKFLQENIDSPEALASAYGASLAPEAEDVLIPEASDEAGEISTPGPEVDQTTDTLPEIAPDRPQHKAHVEALKPLKEDLKKAKAAQDALSDDDFNNPDHPANVAVDEARAKIKSVEQDYMVSEALRIHGDAAGIEAYIAKHGDTHDLNPLREILKEIKKREAGSLEGDQTTVPLDEKNVVDLDARRRDKGPTRDDLIEAGRAQAEAAGEFDLSDDELADIGQEVFDLAGDIEVPASPPGEPGDVVPFPPTTLTPPPVLPPLDEQIKAEAETETEKPPSLEDEMADLSEDDIESMFADEDEGATTPQPPATTDQPPAVTDQPGAEKPKYTVGQRIKTYDTEGKEAGEHTVISVNGETIKVQGDDGVTAYLNAAITDYNPRDPGYVFEENISDAPSKASQALTGRSVSSLSDKELVDALAEVKAERKRVQNEATEVGERPTFLPKPTRIVAMQRLERAAAAISAEQERRLEGRTIEGEFTVEPDPPKVPALEGDLVDELDLAEQTRANIAGKPPEQASLIILRDMLEAGTDVMNDGQLPTDIRAAASALSARIDAALKSGDIAGVQKEAIESVREWLKDSGLGDAEASDLRAIQKAIQSQLTLPAGQYGIQVRETVEKDDGTTALEWVDVGEGPFNTQEEAQAFLDAEVGGKNARVYPIGDESAVGAEPDLARAEDAWTKGLTRAGRQDLLEIAGIKNIQGVSGTTWNNLSDENKAAIGKAVQTAAEKVPESFEEAIRLTTLKAPPGFQIIDEGERKGVAVYRSGVPTKATGINRSIAGVEEALRQARRMAQEDANAKQPETGGPADGDLTDAVAPGEREPGQPEPETTAGDQEPGAGTDAGPAGTETDESQPERPDLATQPRPVDFDDATPQAAIGDKEAEAAFAKLADDQRGLPERAMLRLQKIVGGGVYSGNAEHIGDLTHRMSESFDFMKGGFEFVTEKVNRALRYLESGYGFEREMRENEVNNAKERGVDLEAHRAAVKAAGKEYADEHRKLKVYNQPQYFARAAAIAFGEQRFGDARMMLNALKRLIGDLDSYRNAVNTVFRDKNGKLLEFDAIAIADDAADDADAEFAHRKNLTDQEVISFAKRMLDAGANAGSKEDGSPSIISVGSQNWLSDHEEDHAADVQRFVASAERAGWNRVSQSKNGQKINFMVGNDQVQVYKVGKGMGYAVMLRPEESEWKKGLVVMATIDVTTGVEMEALRSGIRTAILDDPAALTELTSGTLEDFVPNAKLAIGKALDKLHEEAADDPDRQKLIAVLKEPGKPLNEKVFTDAYFDELRADVFSRIKKNEAEKARAERSEIKKESTGDPLRRHWELMKNRIKNADRSDEEVFIQSLVDSTARAGVFNIEEILGTGYTPGAMRIMQSLRTNLPTYTDLVRNQIKRGWRGMKLIQMVQYKYATLDQLQELADSYVEGMSEAAKRLKGVKSINEIVKIANELKATKLDGSLSDPHSYISYRLRSALLWYAGQDSRTMQKRLENELKTDTELGLVSKKLRRPKHDVKDMQRDGLDDVLKGKDVSTQQLKERFNFADITIGKQAEGKGARVTQHVNKAMEAFHDLAQVWGIDDKAISLDGLHFAIGALGHGRHAAHYSPNHPLAGGGTVKVINVTYKKGDGTVAHEWTHALDYATRRNPDDRKAVRMAINRLKYALDMKSAEAIKKKVDQFLDGDIYYKSEKRAGREAAALRFLRNTRRELESFSGGYGSTHTDFYRSARTHSNKKYWASDVELFARAGEAWVYDQLLEKGARNDYLVDDWVADGKVTPPAYKFAPYPQGEERELVNDIFSTLARNLVVKDGTASFKAEVIKDLDAPRQKMLDMIDKIEADLESYAKARKEKEAREKAQKAREDQEAKEAAEAERARQMAEEIARLEAEDKIAADEDLSLEDQMAGMSEDDIDSMFGDIEDAVDETSQDQFFDESQQKPETPPMDEDAFTDDPLHKGQLKLIAALRGSLPKRIRANAAMSNHQLFELADASIGGTQGQGAYTKKDAYDALEVAVNQVILDELATGTNMADDAAAIAWLNKLTAILPTQANRSEEQVEFQMFSTPPALSFVAARAADIRSNDFLLEPSAGTGSLAIYGKAVGAHVTTNELSMRRSVLLEEIGADQIFNIDARYINNVNEITAPSVVLMNPPFSSAPGSGMKNKTMIGAEHVEAALKMLRPGGRLVAIVGRGMGREKATFRDWWKRMDKTYHVRAAIPVSGENYKKYGTTFDNVLLVIDKKPDVQGDLLRHTSASEVVVGELVTDLAEIPARLGDILNDRHQLEIESPSEQQVRQDARKDGPRTGPTDDRINRPDDDASGRGDAPPGVPPPGGAPKGPADGAGGRATRDGAKGTGTGGRRSGPDTGTGKGTKSTGTGTAPDLGAPPTDAPGSPGVSGDLTADQARAELLKLFGKDPSASEDPADYGDIPIPAGIDQNMLPKVMALLDAEWNGIVENPLKSSTDGKPWTIKDFVQYAIKTYGQGGGKAYVKYWFQTTVKKTQEQKKNRPPPRTDKPRKEGDKEQLQDTVTEPWTPTFEVEGAKPHKANIVESAAMAAVSLPGTDYRPKGLDKLIESGDVSDAQLEVPILAGAAHESFIKDEQGNERRLGFAVGDGTGFGKTRELIAIMLDNIARGRKKIIVLSQKPELMSQLQDDIDAMGVTKQIPMENLQKVDIKTQPPLSEGVLFSSYDLLGRSLSSFLKGKNLGLLKNQRVSVQGRMGTVVSVAAGKGTARIRFDDSRTPQVVPISDLVKVGPEPSPDRTRVQQIIDWVGPDFDGVLIMDEAHNMANSQGEGAAKKAMAGLQLQDMLPKARVVYATATAATEVSQLAYMNRLGLWGQGTQFATLDEFVAEIEAAGVRGMEKVVADLKAMGLFVARSISMEGVTKELITHEITEEQGFIYERLARSWQAIVNNMQIAAQMTNSTNDMAYKRRVSQIWGFQQRLFKNVLVSMKAPTMFPKIDELLANGESIIIQGFTTGEAENNRAVIRAADLGIDLSDVEISPKEALIEMVKRVFPVDQLEVIMGDNNKPTTRPVIGPNGQPMKNQEALAMRDRIITELNDIRIPENFLDQIINHYGVDNVSEMTGRKERPVRDETGKVTMVATPGQKADKQAFADGKKRILYFTSAGATGESYHASNRIKNKQHRNHFLVDPPWGASNAMQGLGRANRADQASSPTLYLVQTNLKSEQRVFSTLARRLDQLGALSQGERKTAGAGVVDSNMNLETPYAVAALENFIQGIAAERIKDISPQDFARETGLFNVFNEDGGVNKRSIPDIPQFLNRLLSMTPTRQNVYFDYFWKLMRANVEAAIANGTYDVGMETLVFESAEKVHEEVVNVDPRSGAETKYVKLETSEPVKYMSFEETVRMAHSDVADLLFYGVNRNNEIAAYFHAPPSTSTSGAVTNRYRRFGIRGIASYPDENAVRTGEHGNVKRVDDLQEVKRLWNQEIAEAPTHSIDELHLITGVVLNVWNAVSGNTRVVRVKDDAGEIHLGQVVPRQRLNTTLHNLQATGALKPTYSPDVIFERIWTSNWRFKLNAGAYSNWSLQRSKVSREARIEIVGAQAFSHAELETAGALSEIIQHKTRWFIPTVKSDAAGVIQRLLVNHPVTDAIPPEGVGGVSEDAASYTKRDDASPLTNEFAAQIAHENRAQAEIDNYQGRLDTFAIAFNRDLINQHAAPLVGHTIETAEDLARLAQRYRDPRYETLRYFFLDGDGKIIAQTGVSSRMPGSTAAFPRGESDAWVEDMATDLGAKSVYMLHNHPSGNSKPSDNDLQLTKDYAEILSEKGIDVVHVIIDSNEYTAMVPVGGKLTVNERAKLDMGEDLLLKPGKPHHLLGTEIIGKDGPRQLAKLSKALEQRADVITVVGRNSEGKVVAIASMGMEVYTGSYQALKKELQTWGRAHGVRSLFLVGVPDQDRADIGNKGEFNREAIPRSQRLKTGDVILDAITVSGHFVPSRTRTFQQVVHGPFQLGIENIAAEAREVAEPGASYSSDATRNQETTLERLRLNKPLDRIIRGMFTGFGAWKGILNDKGEFKAGTAAHDRMVNFLKDGKFNPDGNFGWMNNILEHARHGLIDRYKVPKEFIQRSFEAITQERKILGKGLEFLQRLQESGVTTLEEATVIQQMLTSEDVDENQWSALTEEIRASIVELGQMALDLNLITKESYERNKGIYLHRVYQKYEGLSDENSLTRWLARFGGKRHAIKGDELKGRGIFKDVTFWRLMRDAPKVAKRMEGKPNTDLIGTKFTIMDFYDPEKVDPDTDTSITAKRSKLRGRPKGLSKRVYWPVGEPMPRRFENEGWVNQGDFVVRRVHGDKFVLWRDFNKDERTQMGEILDARYTLAKTYHLLAKDLATGSLFKDIAANPEWTWQEASPPPPEIVADRSKTLRDYIGYEWVEVPNNRIPRSATKKWGALAGKYVRAEIWKDLNEVDRMNQKGPWQWLLTQWKLNKTARNPVVHMNNVMSNLILMDLIDVSSTDLYRGLLAYIEKGEDYREAFDNGAFGSSYIDQEILDSTLKPILREMQKMAKEGQFDSGNQGYMAKVKFANQFARIVSENVRRFDDKSQDLYRIEDEVFRMATYMRRRAMGESADEAATLAREQFLNYDIRAPWVNAARRSVLPFISYTYRAVPAIAEALMRRPWKVAKYALVANVVNAMAYAVTDDDEELERRSMREEVQGNVWIPGVPRMIRMPANDKNGNPVYLDIRRWIPAGDVFDVAPNNPIPIPAWLHFSGPLMIAGEMMLNRSAFTGEDIVNEHTDSLGDKTHKYGAFLYRSLAPSAPWIPESWYWQKLGQAATGARDTLGRTYSMPQAIASSVGVKAAGHDVTLNYQYRAREFDRTYRALRATLRQAARDHERGILTTGAYQELRADTVQKLERLGTKREHTFGRIGEVDRDD